MSEDLIKRSDAIDAVMNTEPVFAVDSLEPYQKTKDVVEALEAIPSAEPKTGEWDLCKDDDGVYGVCSICGCYVDFSLYGRPYKVCPHCGAKMREGDNNGDGI